MFVLGSRSEANYFSCRCKFGFFVVGGLLPDSSSGRKTGLLKENMINGLNQFVFKATLPVLLFGDLAKQDFAEAWNGK